MHKSQINKIVELTDRLNKHRHEYYNLNKPEISDAEYDKLYDELLQLEKLHSFAMTTSPTQTVGFTSVSKLKKASHPTPLLSIEKTKNTEDILSFIGTRPALVMLKLDGLTVKLEYENGQLTRASTRGDGNEGENITHNAKVFRDLPLTIPYRSRLVITGEALIKNDDFEHMQKTLVGSDGNTYKTSRNLAAGSVRLLDPAICAKRCVQFYAFNVLEVEDYAIPGIDEASTWRNVNSKTNRLEFLESLGFNVCQRFTLNAAAERNQPPSLTIGFLETYIAAMKDSAERLSLPIDGLVITYDDIEYSKSLGRTGHHYKDSIAFKFDDEAVETNLTGIEWTPSRFGEITPVAIFDTVEIDGCEVSRASLHNLSFIKELELTPGCRILVSKRNMIIPHVEENLDRGNFDMAIVPSVCPGCGHPSKIVFSDHVNKLQCCNPGCAVKRLKQFVHFVSKKAMDIEGISEATLDKFIKLGWLHDFTDIYRLCDHRREIIHVDGFGEKSWQRLWDSIQRSRNTTFERYLISMDIPMIGRTASKELSHHFYGSLSVFEDAVDSGFDFTQLSDFGEVMHRNIHEWFRIEENRILWEELQTMININQTTSSTSVANNPFSGCTIAVTGKLEHFTRNSINSKIESFGAKASSSVTKNTDYLICGEKAGSKLENARKLGIQVISEQQFLEMVENEQQ